MIYRNIKAIADEKGISIRRIELDTGITPSSIYHWDKIKPSVDKVAKVADYLGVPIEKLLVWLRRWKGVCQNLKENLLKEIRF